MEEPHGWMALNSVVVRAEYDFQEDGLEKGWLRCVHSKASKLQEH